MILLGVLDSQNFGIYKKIRQDLYIIILRNYFVSNYVDSQAEAVGFDV